MAFQTPIASTDAYKDSFFLRLLGIGMPSLILWSRPLKLQRIVWLSSILWWELWTTFPGLQVLVSDCHFGISPVNYSDVDTYSLYWLTHPPTHPLTYTPTYPLIHSNELYPQRLYHKHSLDIKWTPVKLKSNTNFLNHFPVTVDKFSKTWSFLTYSQDPSVKNIKVWKRSIIKIFPIEDNAFLK